MGLDMYLYKKTYVRNWDYMKPEDKDIITIKRGGKKRPDIDIKKVSYIVETIGEWRKANAIHKWFVENVQNGIDDCGEYDVEEDQLQELLKAVNIVIASCELVDGDISNGYTFVNGKEEPIMQKGKYIKDSSVAREYLPTTEGFFFGGTEYDQWYYGDLLITKDILEDALKYPRATFSYTSSW